MSQIYQFIFIKGGPVMIPILLGSVIALGLFIERLLALRRSRVLPLGLRRRVRVMVREGRLAEAEVLCQENDSVLAAIISSALGEAGRSREQLKEAVSEAGRREVAQLERRVDLLGTIAAVEPLLGLLGTVLGLIGAFQRVEVFAGQGQGVNPGALAAGIWEALITTAAGLVVAIPAYVAYRYLQSRVTAVAVDLEEDALQLATLIADTTQGMTPVHDKAGDDG